MAFSDNLSGVVRRIYDDGLDEVLVFAIIFIIILLTGKGSEEEDNLGIVPIVIIAVFLLIFYLTNRTEEGRPQ
ncbi:MAG: hypothetical protein GXY17_02475 [Clostridiaceae bacterium]|nr:hypothetical protein [Clostridiaceae bacterium]